VIAFVPGLLIGLFCGAFLAAGAGFVMALRESDRHQVELERARDEAHRRGRLDERAATLARALWEADNLPYGGSE
jgi:hypothetical protein